MRPLERDELEVIIRQQMSGQHAKELKADALEFHRKHLAVVVLSNMDKSRIID